MITSEGEAGKSGADYSRGARMAEFFMGQVMMTGFGYAQKFFAGCDGATMQISQNQALFTLLGITYGGNGVTTFMLPDLRGRTPAGAVVSQNAGWQPIPYSWGMIAGVEQVSLSGDQNGPHSHGMSATTSAGTSAYVDADQIMAQVASPSMLYGPAQALLPLGGGPSSTAGAGSPHDNMQPYQVIQFNIALNGIYPSRS